MPRAGGAVRRPDAGQDVGDLPGGLRVEDRAAGGRRGSTGSVPSRSALDLAAIGKAGVELHEVAQRDADAAKPDGEARRFVARQVRRHAGLAEAGGQPRRADRVEQAHGRHVERQLQRLADADVALVAHVEIARPVAGEIGRPVLDHRFLRDQALLRRQAHR